MARTLDDILHERQALDTSHNQNESNRDSFIAIAHTALFAASVSFVGDVAPLSKAIWQPLLIAGWAADVLGLVALAISFVAARREIDARRQALNAEVPPSGGLADTLNAIALWSFPLALVLIFSFVTANVVQADVGKNAATSIESSSGRSEERVDPTPRGRRPGPASCRHPGRRLHRHHLLRRLRQRPRWSSP